MLPVMTGATKAGRFVVIYKIMENGLTQWGIQRWFGGSTESQFDLKLVHILRGNLFIKSSPIMKFEPDSKIFDQFPLLKALNKTNKINIFIKRLTSKSKLCNQTVC